MGAPSFIDVFDDALEADYCATLIAKFEADERKYEGGVVGANGEFALCPEFKKVTELAISFLSEWSDVEIALRENLGKHLELMKDNHLGLKHLGGAGGTISKQNISRIRAKRYDNDSTNHFNWHVDNVSFDQSCRVMTFQWYLNTVEEGGETDFPEYGLKVKPVAGRMVAFPPTWTHYHRALPPVSEPKYIINTWLQYDGTERIP